MHPILDIMKIKSFIGGFDKNFCYVIWCEYTKLGAVIDPSVVPIQIFEFLEKKNIILDKILVTHTHRDHINYINEFLDQYPLVNIYGHNKPLYNFDGNYYKGLTHLENVNIGKSMISTLFTPGHYADSVCYWNVNQQVLFTGDTMFVGRTGRVKSNSSNIDDLYNSIYNVILKLHEKTMIYPGHHYGYKKSISLCDNIILSDFFQCINKNEFYEVMKKFEKNRPNN